MFDVSWGELAVVMGLGFVVIGKKDLPKAAGVVGNRLGRIVGLLQGARARADTFAQQSELKQLHNELKSGLRELDAVKSEMAVAMSSRGMQGIGGGGSNMISRTVLSPSGGGATTASSSSSSSTEQLQQSTTTTPSPASASPQTSESASAAATSFPHHQRIIAPPPPPSSINELPPESQTIAAVAEDEWVKRGIGFKSKAERGVGLGYSDEDSNNPLNSGSSILAHIYQQNLIFDQYDRVVQNQDLVLQSKIDTIQARRQQQQQQQQQKPEEEKEKEEEKNNQKKEL